MKNNQSKIYRAEEPNPSLQVKKNDIAIIGMACRFPGAKNYEEFWDNLLQGGSSIQEIPLERWDWKTCWGYPETNKWGGFIDDVDAFDFGFFNLSAREVEAMDPQQRIMLELSWSCMEDAGLCPSQLSGEKIGVLIGVTNLDYKEIHEKEAYPIEGYCATGTAPPMIPNRISFYYNFKGPSISLDTACSSSLDAIHLAGHLIRNGECVMALVGGVNLMLTPRRHIAFSKMGILSPTGCCKAFDDGADGTLRGEGAGLILLKSLGKAIEDGNHIYGVLKGSAINHNGKTHTLTYPNQETQTEVIIEAYKSAGITPENISYIETHGTGTRKGDPIEFEGLVKAFQSFPAGEKNISKTAFCGLGSVKPNIGHLESASGIAGVIKVLLCMKYHCLPKLHNFKQLNHRISIQDTPFYIVEQSRDWKPQKGKNNRVIPRRAGISAFGAGGTNAHVVIEEALNLNKPADVKSPCYLICLSAKTEEALWRRKEDLIFWLEKNGKKNNLFDISATLLLGREHFEIREAFIVRNIDDLRNQLQQNLANVETELYLKNSNVGKKEQIQPLDEELGQTIIKELYSLNPIDTDNQDFEPKLIALAGFYVRGHNLDWHVIFSGAKYCRISLPTYPFAKDRFRIPQRNTKSANTPALAQSIHPLLQQNTSTFNKQQYSSTFTGEEFFFADHVVNGRRILPGVAYLEMARAAIAGAAENSEEDGLPVIRLKNVVWLRPIAVLDQSVQVHVALFPEPEGEITFKIYSRPQKVDAGQVVHCQGKAIVSKERKTLHLDLNTLLTRSGQSISFDQYYETFESMGVKYGLAYRSIEHLYPGSDYVLIKLSLPSSVTDSMSDYVLHPSMMDSALQAIMYLLRDNEDTLAMDRHLSFKTALAFSLSEIEIFNSCQASMWALVKHSGQDTPHDKAQKYDIGICDDAGIVCARMRGFSLRVMEGENKKVIANPVPFNDSKMVETSIFTPVLDPVTVKKGHVFPALTDHVLVVGGTAENRRAIRQQYPNASLLDFDFRDTTDGLVKMLETHGLISHIIWCSPWGLLNSIVDDALIAGQEEGVVQGFKMIKALISLGYDKKNLGWTVITTRTLNIGVEEKLNPTHSSFRDLIYQLAQEYPNWKIRLIDMEDELNWPISGIFTLPTVTTHEPLVYRGGEWHRQKLVQMQFSQINATLYKANGVYVITGDTDVLAEAWSEYMIRNYQAQVIWIGRSRNYNGGGEKLTGITKVAAIPPPHYIEMDLTDQNALQMTCEKIRERFGRINGVIHMIPALPYRSFEDMDENYFRKVLAVQVDDNVRIARVFQNEFPDFIMYFSLTNGFSELPSSNGALSALTRAGYSFINAFARRLSQEWPCAVKVINWGFRDGGWSAMKALELILSCPMEQFILLKPTDALNFEGVCPEESVKLNADSHPSLIKNMQKDIPSHNTPLQYMKAARG